MASFIATLGCRAAQAGVLLAGVLLAGALGATAPGLAQAQVQVRQAPFGDKVSAAIVNYNRATPYIATSGRYGPATIAEVKALGFATTIELRGPEEEGVAANAAAAKTAGLHVVHIPVTTRAPSEEQVRAFAAVVEDEANYPILVNCVSANRTGAMWALYRARAGVPAEIALEEGRTAGLMSREPAVRARLGLPPAKP